MGPNSTTNQWPADHPLIESIGRAAALNRLFAMPVQSSGQSGWIKAESLFQGDDEGLRGLVIDYGRSRWGTDNRHVAGSGFIVAYLTRLTYPLISQYVLADRVPDVSLSNLTFHSAGHGIDGTALNRPHFAALPGDPASGHPDAQVVPDEAALYAQLKEWLFDSNFEVVIPSLRRSARSSLKVSWNAVASSCSQAFSRLYKLVGEPKIVVRKAEQFFGDPSSPAYRQVTMDIIEHRGKRGYFARRAGCCLWWRVESSRDYCSGCILLSREEQDARFRDMLEHGR